MKNYKCATISVLFLWRLCLSPALVIAQNNDSLVVYVWEFTTRDGERNEITTSVTEEFEEALIQSECCTILQRRNYARLFDQKQNEKAIINLEDIPKSALDGLKALEANAVTFGEVYDDTNSGQVKISVNLESFEGEILKKASTYLPKFAIADPSKREEAVKKLIAELGFIPSGFSNSEIKMTEEIRSQINFYNTVKIKHMINAENVKVNQNNLKKDNFK